ncbi:MAG: hypothetical protein KBS59_02410, partial [Clostridiales bacterium]|nr:hypothetical protein [Clostridiales bacterium]
YYICTGCSATFADAGGIHQISLRKIRISATGHTVVIDEPVEPTCVESGLTMGSHCEICGEIITPQKTVPAAGHKAVIDAPTDPTCEEDGKTSGSHCDICGEIITPQQTIEATGHSFSPDAYAYDESSHWHVCEKCREKTGITPHTFVVSSEKGVTVYACECGYSKTENHKLEWIVGVISDAMRTRITVFDAEIPVYMPAAATLLTTAALAVVLSIVKKAKRK